MACKSSLINFTFFLSQVVFEEAEVEVAVVEEEAVVEEASEEEEVAVVDVDSEVGRFSIILQCFGYFS